MDTRMSAHTRHAWTIENMRRVQLYVWTAAARPRSVPRRALVSRAAGFPLTKFQLSTHVYRKAVKLRSCRPQALVSIARFTKVTTTCWHVYIFSAR